MALKSVLMSRSVRCFSPLFSSIKLKGVCSKKSPSGAVRTEEEVQDMFEEWAKMYRKSYETEGEKEKRFEVFRKSLREADLIKAGKDPYLDHLSDFTHDEIKHYYRCGLGGGSLVAIVYD
ncbi:hypothetical protein QVD17_03181 [Tagetes erecta]|uniref:Cathepsin propeptide inhibitor domain-containing protein n=1 Tax=Tagetes erecta TaxID=13708 RepID=A0AAD8L7X4_TARER|nr:hypothetical protein QVD17_03181 [Tagetes erecta]